MLSNKNNISACHSCEQLLANIAKQQENLVLELKELYSLVDVCTQAIKATGTLEDASSVDVLNIALNRIFPLCQNLERESKALVQQIEALEGGE